MKKIIFKIGGSLTDDLKEMAKGPKKRKGGTTTVYLKNLGSFREMMTPKRLGLLDEIINYGDNRNVSAIANKLNRKQEAVSRDLAVLEKNGLVHKTKHKQHVHPALSFSVIQIELGKAVA